MLFVTSLYSRESKDWTLEEFTHHRKQATKPFTCFEYLKDDVWTKPFFDYEAYFDSAVDPHVHERKVLDAVAGLFDDDPNFSPEQVALAQRHRWCGNKYKVSVRAYVQGYRIKFTQIKALIKEIITEGTPIFDLSIYSTERLLGVVGGSKSNEDTAILQPITHVDDPAAFLAQHLVGDETPMGATTDSTVAYERLHEAAIAAENYLSLYRKVKPMIETKLNNTVTRTYQKENGFDFDVQDRSIPCALCGGTHDSNNYTCRSIITQCVKVGNYSEHCRTSAIVGWDGHPLLQSIYTYPVSDTPYVEMYAAHVASKGCQLRYDGHRFLYHDGILWKEVSDLQLSQNVQNLAVTVISALLGYLQPTHSGQRDETTKKYVVKPDDIYVALLKGNAFVKRWSGMDSVTKAARVTLYDGNLESLMDKDNDLLGTKSGVVDTRTGELRSGSPEDYVSMSVDAEWAGIDGRTDIIDSFFGSIFNDDKTVIRFVQKLLGYGITGHVKLQLWVVFWGKGSNGKGVLNTMLEKLLGENQYYLSMHRDCLFKNSRRTSQGAATPHLAELKGKRIAICDESAEDDVLDESTIKQVTGGSQINCRLLHQNPIAFTPTHLPILMTNNKPRMNIDDVAMTRRLILVPFLNRYVKDADFDPNNPTHRHIDYELVDKLSAPGARRQFLTWLVQGAVAWNQEGLGEHPQLIKSAYEEYLQENDAIGRFIKEHCIVDEGAFVSVTEFKEAFNVAADTPLDSKKIKQKMENRGFVSKQMKLCGTTTRVFRGLRFANGPISPT
jgi:P4 family phage/plasmid primase-like protien